MRCGNQNKMDKTKTDDTRKHIPWPYYTDWQRPNTHTLYIKKYENKVNTFPFAMQKKPQNFWDHREQSLYHTLGFVYNEVNVVKCQFWIHELTILSSRMIMNEKNPISGRYTPPDLGLCRLDCFPFVFVLISYLNCLFML